MCLRPLSIINKGYDPNDKYSSYFVRVPCGKCEECAQQRVSDVLFRADYEYQDMLKCGGTAFFLTLTFNDEHLNIYTYSDGSKCSTWNGKLLQRYTHRLNTHLSRCGYSLKYLITSERGNNGTHRPHYHCIFFLRPACGAPTHPLGYVEQCFTRFWSTSKTASYLPLGGGRSSASTSPIGLVHIETISRTQLEAIKYTCKYAFKSHGDVIFQKAQEDIVCSSLHVPYRNAVPRSYFSKGIGACFFNNISITDMPQFFASFYSHQSDGRVTTIPRYYIRKFFYTTAVLLEEDVHDTSKEFNGYKHVNKWPLKVVASSLAIRVRHRTRTVSIRYPIGDKYLELIRHIRFSYYYSWLHNFNFSSPYDYNFISSLSPSLGNYLHKLQESQPLLSSMVSRLRNFDYSNMYHLYCDSLHRCNTDNLSLTRLSHGLSDIEATAISLDVFAFFNQLSGSSKFYQNKLRYKNFLFDAAKKRPLLFLPKD